MTARDDDELAETVAASTPAARAPGPPAAPLTGQLGRYCIEHELGRGGMGVVYAAFNPELERRVALKVIPNATAEDARARLLREGRAMARLASAHVVTVFEVGTIDGHDFVAMELMDRGTLADWLAGKRRTTREIVAAFSAAGRGLADAHVAGLVHRDFKPANVLRGRDGRFAVTDFGLARESTTGETPRRSERVSEPVAAQPRPALDDVTQTGWVLGTPQYMAPEQWENHVVTPATDQFAFCVSLWEGLAGERPYRGASGETLRTAVSRGPRELDASGVPRRLRPILLRGLDPDPDRRWPSMDVLLAALARAQRQPVRRAQVAAAIVITGCVVGAVLWSRHAGRPRCAEPTNDPDGLWSADARAALRTNGFGSDQLAVIDGDVAAWHDAWDARCTEAPRAACLDGVAGHLAGVLRIAAQGPVDAAQRDALLDALAPPTMCLQTAVPRLIARWTPAEEQIFTQLIALSSQTVRPPQIAVPTPSPDDGCAVMLAAELRTATGNADPEQDVGAEERVTACADDHFDAIADVFDLEGTNVDGFSDGLYDARVERLDTRYGRFADSAVQGFVAYARGQKARDAGDLGAALAHFELARVLVAARGLRARVSTVVIDEIHARLARWSDRDRAEVPAAIAAELASATSPADRYEISRLDAMARWSAGDLAAAHRTDAPVRDVDAAGLIRVTGIVVDARGAPVAGAQVSTSHYILADRLGVAEWLSDTPRTATTDASGQFAIDGAWAESVIVAVAGDLRSLPADAGSAMRLELRPTTRLAGVVHFAGEQPGHATVAVGVNGRLGYRVLAPVAADGTFELVGVPEVPVEIGVFALPDAENGWWRPVTPAESRAGRIVVDAPGMTRTLSVIARSATSAPLALARIVVLSGAISVTDAEALMHQENAADMFAGRASGGELAGIRLRRDDVAVTLHHLPATGALTACAFGSFDNVSDHARYDLLSTHLAEIPVQCAAVGPTDDGIVLELAPSKRVGD